ncbi:hypothetical protein MRX96_055622 [Rhipicephalus microplus]
MARRGITRAVSQGRHVDAPCVPLSRFPCESGFGGSACRVRCSNVGCSSCGVSIFVRDTVKIPLRDWFWWLHLPSPMFKRCMLIMRRVEELFVRATVKIPLQEWFRWLRLPSAMFQRWMLIVWRVEELFMRATVKIRLQ